MAEDSQKQILKTAGEMFFRLGVRSVSIDDICHELGMSKKTFYVYFASKEELIDRMLQQNINYIREKMEELVQLGDFREIVRKFMKHQEAERMDVRRVPQLVYDLKKYYPRQFQDFQLRCFEVQKQYIGSYLQQGVSARIYSVSFCQDSQRYHSRFGVAGGAKYQCPPHGLYGDGYLCKGYLVGRRVEIV